MLQISPGQSLTGKTQETDAAPVYLSTVLCMLLVVTVDA